MDSGNSDTGNTRPDRRFMDGLRSFVAIAVRELIEEAPAVTLGGGGALFGWAMGRSSQLPNSGPRSGFWSVWAIIAICVMAIGGALWVVRAISRHRSEPDITNRESVEQMVGRVESLIQSAVSVQGVHGVTVTSASVTGTTSLLDASKTRDSLYPQLPPVYPPLPPIYSSFGTTFSPLSESEDGEDE